MASLTPISTYNLSLKPFNPVPAIEDEFPVTIRLTVAAVDPEAVDDKEEPSTLRLLKRSDLFSDDDFDSEDEEDFDEDDEESEEEEAPKDKSKKSKKQEDDLDDEDEDDDDSSEDDEDEDDEDGVSEFVICTLSPKVQFQQTLDLTIRPDEEVYFVVTGSYPIHLTGNYVEHPADDDSDDYDEEYSDEEDNLTPDEDEIIAEQDYDLDDLEDASDIENRIEKLLEEDEKNSKKRVANDEPKKSKKAKKEDKKSVQFSDELEQGPTGSTLVEKKKDKKEKSKKKDEKDDKKSDKKADSDSSKKFPTKTLLGGVITEDRKLGKGPAAKSGNKVGIRYIGKLKNGKVFDKNTSGKPFAFGLGKGECIKGFDLGVAGMAVGGERRVIIPPKMGYGSQALPGIPANSELTFDIKLVSIK